MNVLIDPHDAKNQLMIHVKSNRFHPAKWLFKPTAWIVAACAWACVDLISPPSWMLCVLHAAALPVALRYIPHRAAALVSSVSLLAVVSPWLLAVFFPSLASSVDAGTGINTSFDYQFARLWTSLTILTVTLYNIGQQRIRKRRLVSRRALHHRERDRTRQLRKAYELIKRESAQRHSVQQRLAENESHLQSLMQHAGMHLLQKDCEGTFTYVSPTFCALLDRSPADVIGKNDFDIYPSATAWKYREDDLRVMASEEPLEAVEENPQPDGKSSYVRVLKVPEYNEAGDIIGIQAVFWDITERRRSEIELSHSESRKQALFNSAADGILLVGPSEKIMEANPAATSILQVPAHQLNDQKLSDVILPQVISTSSDAEPWRLLPHGIRRETMLRRPRDPTQVFPAELSSHPIPLDNGMGLAIVIRDITTRYQTQVDLREAKELAERASQAKSEFLAGVSHEIRTPLGGILGLSQLLAESELTPRQRSHVDMICQSADLLHGVIEDILDFSRIEAGTLDLDDAKLDLHDCIGQAFKCLAARTVGKGLEMIFHLDADVPRYVYGDAIRLRQIVVNLVGNAIKFTHQGEVCLRLSVAQRGQQDVGKTHFVLEVSDTGIGIASDRQELIFEAFRQADASTTRRFGGTGLGLAIAQRIATAMHGRIEVESELEKGSIFRCHLWLATEPNENVENLTETLNTPHPKPKVAIFTPSDRQYTGLATGLIAIGVEVERIDHPSSDQIKAVFEQSQSTYKAIVLDSTAIPADLNPIIDQYNERPMIWLCKLGDPAPISAHQSHAQLLKPVLPDELRSAVEASVQENTLKSKTQSSTELPASHQSPNATVSDSSVLLVDDSPVNRTVIRELLASIGVAVDAAENGRQAVELAKKKQYELIFMDLQMPEIDGAVASQMILEDCRSRSVAEPIIIALTAHVTEEHRRQCLAAGMTDFITKPVRRERLVETINQYLVSATSSTRPTWRTHFVEVMGQPEELFDSMASAFVIEVPEMLARLETAIATGDRMTIRRAAHTLKSCFRYVSSGHEIQLASQLERDAKQGSIANMSTTLETLRGSRNDLVPAVIKSVGQPFTAFRQNV